MVYTHLNRVQFGNGDVSVVMSMAGTKSEPNAVLLLQNIEPTKIGPVIDHTDPKEIMNERYDPQKDFVLLFSKPESIDWMITALKMIKEKTFGENNQVARYLKEPNPL